MHMSVACDGFCPESQGNNQTEFSANNLNVCFEVHATHVLAVCEGCYAFSDAVRVFELACESSREHGHSKLLIDFRKITGTLTAIQRFELSEKTADLYFKKPYTYLRKIVLLGHEPIVDPNRFGELVAQNRGMPVKVCTDVQEALTWLDTGSIGS